MSHQLKLSRLAIVISIPKGAIMRGLGLLPLRLLNISIPKGAIMSFARIKAWIADVISIPKGAIMRQVQ